MINHEFRRNQTQWVIDRDPWTIEYTQRGDTGADSATTGSFTGRLFPMNNNRGSSRSAGVQGGPESETSRGVILAPWDTVELKRGDTLKCTHDYSGIVRYVTVTFPRQVAWKWEIEVDEIA